MKSILVNALYTLNNHSSWIIWNLFLAFIPLVLSYFLFLKQNQQRNFFWWITFLVFFAFLPNAPYLLTDIIHFIQAIREGYSIWLITLGFIPLHFFAIFLGWEAYVISVISQSHYLKTQGKSNFIFISEILTHALCSMGIFLGRFLRFNSWDFATQPDVVFQSLITILSSPISVLIILLTFTVLTIFYWLTKQITLGTMLRLKQLLHSWQSTPRRRYLS